MERGNSEIPFKLQEKVGQTPIFAESSLPIYIYTRGSETAATFGIPRTFSCFLKQIFNGGFSPIPSMKVKKRVPRWHSLFGLTILHIFNKSAHALVSYIVCEFLAFRLHGMVLGLRILMNIYSIPIHTCDPSFGNRT